MPIALMKRTSLPGIWTSTSGRSAHPFRDIRNVRLAPKETLLHRRWSGYPSTERDCGIMRSLSSPKPFSDAAVAAFPYECRAMAERAARELATFVDDGYRKTSTRMEVLGKPIYVPRRFHFLNTVERADINDGAFPAAQCLLTRSTDGHLRQRALNAIINLRESWIAPFVVPLIGEYVVEIVEDIQASLSSLDQGIYSNFVRENRDIMRTVRSRAVSYWDAYYRDRFPDRAAYPGLVALRQLEEWAS